MYSAPHGRGDFHGQGQPPHYNEGHLQYSHYTPGQQALGIASGHAGGFTSEMSHQQGMGMGGGGGGGGLAAQGPGNNNGPQQVGYGGNPPNNAGGNGGPGGAGAGNGPPGAPGAPGANGMQNTDGSNGQPDYTLAGILHFLQTEWRRYERDRNEWEIERAEMRVSCSRRGGIAMREEGEAWIDALEQARALRRQSVCAGCSAHGQREVMS